MRTGERKRRGKNCERWAQHRDRERESWGGIQSAETTVISCHHCHLGQETYSNVVSVKISWTIKLLRDKHVVCVELASHATLKGLSIVELWHSEKLQSEVNVIDWIKAYSFSVSYNECIGYSIILTNCVLMVLIVYSSKGWHFSVQRSKAELVSGLTVW